MSLRSFLSATAVLATLAFPLISGVVHAADLSDTIEASLNADVLDAFFPRCIDDVNGGYLTEFAYDWYNSNPNADKMIVSQARHVYTASNAALFYPGERAFFRQMADQGYLFLRDKMRDKTNGGYYYSVNRAGTPVDRNKYVYGHAFVIYALANYYKLTGNPEAKQLAVDCFNFLEQKAHDATYLGYHPWTNESGTVISKETSEKDQNSSLHLLEAFSALYRVAPATPLLQTRLQEMVDLFLNKIQTPTGFLQQCFKRDWTGFVGYPTTAWSEDMKWNHISYGHDLEVGYLLYDAAEALGKAADPLINARIKTMVDYSLDNGGFVYNGGVPSYGYFNGSTTSVSNNSRIWWIQAEALNTMLFMSRLYPDDSHDYLGKFYSQWDYINAHFLDKTYGGWLSDADELYKSKGTIWFLAYHTGRAQMNAVNWLRNDITPPSVPAAPSVVSKTQTTVSLTWTGASDNSILSGYQIMQGGISYPVGYTQDLTYTVTGLTAATQYSFSIKAFDVTGNVSDAGASVNVTTDNVTVPPVTYKAGLKGEYFDYTTSLSVIPNLTGKTPQITRTNSTVNFASTTGFWTGLDSRFTDTYASRHSGYVKIATAGSYTFYTKSDDGSKLWIDGKLVVSNDGLHAMIEKSGTITLTSGYHTIRIEFFEEGGGAGLVASYAGPGITKKVIPATVLWQ